MVDLGDDDGSRTTGAGETSSMEAVSDLSLAQGKSFLEDQTVRGFLDQTFVVWVGNIPDSVLHVEQVSRRSGPAHLRKLLQRLGRVDSMALGKSPDKKSLWGFVSFRAETENLRRAIASEQFHAGGPVEHSEGGKVKLSSLASASSGVKMWDALGSSFQGLERARSLSMDMRIPEDGEQGLADGSQHMTESADSEVDRLHRTSSPPWRSPMADSTDSEVDRLERNRSRSIASSLSIKSLSDCGESAGTGSEQRDGPQGATLSYTPKSSFAAPDSVDWTDTVLVLRKADVGKHVERHVKSNREDKAEDVLRVFRRLLSNSSLQRERARERGEKRGLAAKLVWRLWPQLHRLMFPPRSEKLQQLEDAVRRTKVHVHNQIAAGDLDRLIWQIKSDPPLLRQRHADMTAIHYAYVEEQYEIARKLLQQQRDFCRSSFHEMTDLDAVSDIAFDSPRFKGQNYLHLCILAGKLEECRYLLREFPDLSDDLKTGKAVGTQWAPTGRHYFGETPLMFAVALGRKDIVEFLESSHFRGTSEGGRLDLSGLNELRPGVPADRDYYGNGPLHFCVWHHNRDMFEHVL